LQCLATPALRNEGRGFERQAGTKKNDSRAQTFIQKNQTAEHPPNLNHREEIDFMATAAKFRIDVAIHDLLVNSTQLPPAPAEARGMTLPEPVFPQFQQRLNDPGPETPPEQRAWHAKELYRASRGWLFPYVRSRVMPGDFHPITAYLFVEYKCNLDCWYMLVLQQQSQGHD
jgi:hypothetical protein